MEGVVLPPPDLEREGREGERGRDVGCGGGEGRGKKKKVYKIRNLR